jgi:ribosomal protein L9
MDEVIAFFRAIMTKDEAQLARYGLVIDKVTLNHQMDAGRRLGEIEVATKSFVDREITVRVDIDSEN